MKRNLIKEPQVSNQDTVLEKLYGEGKNDYEVAAVSHIGRNRLREWRNARGIPSKTNKKQLVAKISEILLDVSTNTYTSVAAKYGVKRSSISKLVNKFGYFRPEYRPPHRPEMSTYTLTERQNEVLVGDMFGDGGLVATSDNSAYYQFGQCLDQEEFALWKAREFLPLTTRVSYDIDRCKITAGTSTCRQLGLLRKQYYPTGKGNKVLTIEHASQLTPLGLAVWYMGDGSISRNTGLFHVGLQIELEPISDFLSKKFNMDLWPRKYAKEWNLRIMDPDRFFELIAPHVLPHFYYKVPLKYRNLLEGDGGLLMALRRDLKQFL